MSNNEPDLSQLYSLNENERLEARETAHQLILRDIGPEPCFDSFKNHVQSAYPPSVQYTTFGLVMVVWIAAFILSAIRLYIIGSTTYGATVEYAKAVPVSGIAIVLMAESAMIVFSLAASVLAHTAERWLARYILYTGALIATAIALIGNWQTALWNREVTPFSVLETFSPPVLVLFGSYVLKFMVLDQIRQRHEQNQLYQQALAVWKDKVNNPEAHPRWLAVFFHELKKQLILVNNTGTGRTARADILRVMNGHHWRLVCQQELDADNWTQPAQPETVVKEEGLFKLSNNTWGWKNGGGVLHTTTATGKPYTERGARLALTRALKATQPALFSKQ